MSGGRGATVRRGDRSGLVVRRSECGSGVFASDLSCPRARHHDDVEQPRAAPHARGLGHRARARPHQHLQRGRRRRPPGLPRAVGALQRLQQLGRADLVGVLAPLLDVVARADGDGLGADHGGAARQPLALRARLLHRARRVARPDGGGVRPLGDDAHAAAARRVRRAPEAERAAQPADGRAGAVGGGAAGGARRRRRGGEGGAVDRVLEARPPPAARRRPRGAPARRYRRCTTTSSAATASSGRVAAAASARSCTSTS